MLKSLLSNTVFQFILGRAIGFYMLFVGATTRWRKLNPTAMETFFNSQDKHLACIWHGRFTLVHKLWKFGPGAKPAKFLISRSREGGLVAWVSRTVGAEVVRGSAAKRGQQKGGLEAMREMARHLDGGGVMGMTPDGPRGPRMRAKRGPVQLAKIAGASLVPITWSTSNRIVFDSWDKFILPLPFGRGALVWGDAIPVPPDADSAQLEAIRLKLETEMNRICAEADRIAGVAIIEPAPASTDEPSPPEAEPFAAAS